MSNTFASEVRRTLLARRASAAGDLISPDDVLFDQEGALSDIAPKHIHSASRTDRSVSPYRGFLDHNSGS
jgi:hypothetical protein